MFENLKSTLHSIAPNLYFTDFLVDRIKRDDYRGTHKLQHYRWNLDYIKIVLKNLLEFGDKNALYHTNGDIDENYFYENKEVNFGKFLSAINLDLRKINRSVTDNAMRKIIFVNLQRMGFVDRFDKDKHLCKIVKTYRNYRYVQDIVDIINSFNQNEAFLNIYEMMFFVTFLGKEVNNKIINKNIVLQYINEFRALKARQKPIIKALEIFCNPRNFSGNKTNKRDFHNWKNETQTMFNSLALMSYFEYDKNSQRLFLKSNINGKNIKFKRSTLIKNEYFQNQLILDFNGHFFANQIAKFNKIQKTSFGENHKFAKANCG